MVAADEQEVTCFSRTHA